MTEHRVVSQSEISTWQTCKRKWFYNYFRRLTKTTYEPDALTQGTIFHVGMEHRHGDWETELAQAVEDMRDMAEERDHDKVDKQHELARIMIEGLIPWVEEQGIDVGVEVVSKEQKIQANFGPYSIRGKLDELIKDNGAAGFRDWKSGQNFALFDHADIDRQFRIYMLILMEMIKNGELDEAVAPSFGEWIIARKVKRTASAKPPFYGRYRKYYNQHSLDALKRQLDGIMEEMLLSLDKWLTGEYHQDHLFPPNPNSAPMRCGSCTYRDICAMQDDGSDVEGYINEHYMTYDPDARYAEDAPTEKETT